MLHKNTYQCKILIAPEEVWFGQPKYSTCSKNHPTLCRFLLLYSLFYNTVLMFLFAFLLCLNILVYPVILVLKNVMDN